MNVFRGGNWLLLAVSLALGGLVEPAPPDEPKPVTERRAYYPRVIRLQHKPNRPGQLLASFDTDGNGAMLYTSADEGRSWKPLADLRDTTDTKHCCSGLWEVPQPLGTVAAGTLFWAPSMGCSRDPRCRSSINIHRSTDGGKTWRFHSTLATGKVGLWEPEFIVDADGNLVAYYSTEEHRAEGFNQLLAHKVSTDGGRTWGPEVRDVAIPDQPNKPMRPGMAIVRKLAAGYAWPARYVMVYEICGMGCDVFIRFSRDGLTWGNPAQPGTRIESLEGHHLAHAPSFTTLPDGRLLVVGQLLLDAANKPAPASGTVLLVSNPAGAGPWTETPAPVPVPKAYDNPCPNYSSQLLLSADKKRLIEVALRYNGDVCTAYSYSIPFSLNR